MKFDEARLNVPIHNKINKQTYNLSRKLQSKRLIFDS